MTPIVLLAGILLIIFGLAALGAGPTAAKRRQQEHSRTYALALVCGGAVLLVLAIGAMLR